MLLKRLNKSRSLRIVNLLGLVTMFSSMLISFTFIKKELSYDRFHEKADRIVRFSTQWNNEPIDGRNWGIGKDHPFFNGITGIEDMVFLTKINTGVITRNTVPRIVNDFYFVSSNFFDSFSFQLLEGDKQTVLNTPEKAAISRKLAEQIFGTETPLGKEIHLSGQKFEDKTVYVTGVFEDFPETSHFHTDLLLHRSDDENQDLAYTYLLLQKNVKKEYVLQALRQKMDEETAGSKSKASPVLIPIKDIHLHSHVLREMGVNGNITYIYLIASANLLLFFIVLLNLWLNTGLIFSFNRKYYQLLRLNGASSGTVMRDETVMAIALSGAAIFIGGLLSFYLLTRLNLFALLSGREIAALSFGFLTIVVTVSILPVFQRMSSTLFRYNQEETKPTGFFLSQVKYLLIGQYGIVMLVVILGFGINKQMMLIKTSQVGGTDNTILVMDEQPEAVKSKFDILTTELMKHPEFKSVTSAMQLPGSAIRDAIYVQVEGESTADFSSLPILVVGDNFLPFFEITPLAGTVFANNRLSYQKEQELLTAYRSGNMESNLTEEYVINLSAARELGFSSPEEAVGKILRLRHGGGLDYINKGKIVGVTADFNYTTAFEFAQPQLLIQRKIFQHCIMVQLSEKDTEEGIQLFNRIWSEVNPDYPASYTLLQEVYDKVYHNEVKARSLTRIFALLCLIIANLGLIIITTFVIKRKTKEIGVRKVNGATASDIIRMLNSRFVLWIGISFVIALPCAFLILNSWLEQFAQKVKIDGWVYAFAGMLVLTLAIASISWQSWKAATINPVKALKTE